MISPIEDLVAALRDLRGAFRKYAGDRMDPDDLEQRVAYKVLRQIRRGPPPKNVLVYCLVVARREAVAAFRSNRVVEELPPQLASRDGCPVVAAIESERREMVGEAMSKLRPRHREVLDRFYWRGQPPRGVQKLKQRAVRARKGVLAAMLGRVAAT